MSIAKNVFLDSKDIYNPYRFTDSFKEELTALKKVNQIGKRLTASCDGKYIMSNGMLFAYEKDNPHISIAFLDPKIINILTPLMPYTVFIMGNQFYQTYTNGKYDSYEVLANKVNIFFNTTIIDKEEFDLEKFVRFAKKQGCTDFEVIVAYKKGWETNMDVYNAYLKYLKTLTMVEKTVKMPVTLQYTNMDNTIMDKCRGTLDEIQDYGVLTYEQIFTDEEIADFSNKDLPTDIDIPAMTDGRYDASKVGILRIMKNMTPTLAAGSKLTIRVIAAKKNQYVVTEVYTGGSLVCNIFKVFPI